jgi:hypothetical protein
MKNTISESAKLSKDQPILFPCQVVILKDKSFIKINGVQPLPGGGQQSSLKRVYSPDSGEWVLKKHAFSIEEETIVSYIYLFRDIPKEARNGLAEIPFYEIGTYKRTYYEKQYSGNLASLFNCQKKVTGIFEALIDLNLALHTIHSLFYSPPSLTMPFMKPFSLIQSTYCYHGDISPQNVVYELEPSAQEARVVTIKHLRFIDWGAAARTSMSIFTRGWNSPEGVHHSKFPSCITETQAFNLTYGRKKDAWAFGLLAASLIKGGLFYEPSTDVALPNLSFIYNKIKVNSDGTLDDSDIADLQQDEINTEITENVRRIDQSTEIGKKLVVWWNAIRCWLQVNPDMRCDLEQKFVTKQCELYSLSQRKDC